MNSLQETIKLMQKQNLKMKSAIGSNSMQILAEAIGKQNKISLNLAGVGGFMDVARSFSQQKNPFTMSIENSLKTQLAALQIPKNNFALFGLASSLVGLEKTNQLASERLSGFLTSQLFLSNSLTEMAKKMQQSHLNIFNPFGVAIQGISKAYLKDINWTRNWEEIGVAEEVNDAITNTTEEILSSINQVTLQDLDNLRTSIIVELSDLLTKTRTEKARQFIMELLTIISFFLTFYGTYLGKSDLSNRDVVNETKKEIGKVNNVLLDKIETEFTKLNKTRIANANVKLKFSAKKKSQNIGLVKSGQKVTVIEIIHKYLLISYIDNETGEPKSGFVSKKYFDIEK